MLNLGRNLPCRRLSTPFLGKFEGGGCKPGSLLWSWLWGSQLGWAMTKLSCTQGSYSCESFFLSRFNEHGYPSGVEP